MGLKSGVLSLGPASLGPLVSDSDPSEGIKSIFPVIVSPINVRVTGCGKQPDRHHTFIVRWRI